MVPTGGASFSGFAAGSGRGARCLSLALGATVATLGASVLLGWALDVPALKSAGTVGPTMKVNTALAMGGLGGGLVLHHQGRPRARCVAVGAALGIAVATLVQYAFGVDLGIDELLVRDAPGDPFTLHPGRMALSTAVAVVGASIALLAARRATLSQVLALVPATIATLNLVEYTFAVSLFRGPIGATRMAIHVAVALLLVSAGIVLARPGRGPFAPLVADTSGGAIVRAVPAFAGVPILLAFLGHLGARAGLFAEATAVALVATTGAFAGGTFALWLGRRLHVREVALRHAESDRARQAREIATVLAAVPAGIAWVDPSLRYRYANDAWARVAGRPAPPGGSLDEDFPEASARSIPALVRRALERGAREAEADVTRDGQSRVLHVRVVPANAEGGCVVAVDDVTEARRVEEERRAQEMRFRLVFESDLLGLLFWGRDQRILDANDAFLGLVGRSRAEVEAGTLNWRDVAPPDHEARDARAREQIHAVGRCEPYERDLVRADGVRVPVLVAGTAFEVGPVQGVSFVLDLTERKRLEAQLAHAWRLTAIGELAAGVVHEINNPATVILSRTEVLARRARTWAKDPQEAGASAILAEVNDATDLVLLAVRRIRDITAGLRSFARMETARLGPVSLAQVARDAIVLVRHEIRLHAHLVEELDEVPPVHGDAGRLGQVAVNLLANAAQAFPAPSPHNVVRVRTFVDGDAVCLSVEDTGTGMPPDVRARLFQPFFTTKPNGKGTGLGLSLSANLVRQHGGHIVVDSEPGRGSTFVVRLPRAPAATDATPDVEPVPLPAPPVARRLRVLAIDDDPAMVAVFRAVLGELHTLAVAQGGAEAIRLLERDPAFDTVICDLVMVGVDGVAVIEFVERTRPRLLPRLLVCTAGLFSPSAERLIQRTGLPVLRKPFTPDQLLEAVTSVAERELPPA